VGALMQNLALVWFMVFNATFKNISVSFIGGGNWSTQRKPLTYCKSLQSLKKWLPGILKKRIKIVSSKIIIAEIYLPYLCSNHKSSLSFLI
jgi:hypothetical protein